LGNDIGQTGGEHQLVGQAFFRFDQQRLAMERFARPVAAQSWQRLTEGYFAATPFVFAPARRKIACLKMNEAARQSCFGIMRLQFQTTIKVLQRFVQSPQFEQHRPQADITGRKTRIEFQSAQVMRYGLLRPASIPERICDIVVELRVLSIDFHGLRDGLDGQSRSAGLLRQDTQQMQCIGMIRFVAQHLADHGLSARQITGLMLFHRLG
jgi:hypothetical protein